MIRYGGSVAALMFLVVMATGHAQAQQQLIFPAFSGFAMSDEVTGTNGSSIRFVVGESFVGRPASAEMTIHSGHLPVCFVPIATVGIDDGDGLRVVDSARAWSHAADTTMCQGDEVVLRVVGRGGIRWSTGDTTETITVRPQSDMTVWVQRFLPGGSTVDAACYASIPDTITIPLHRLSAEVHIGNLGPIDPRDEATALGAAIPVTLASHINLNRCPPDSLTLSVRMNRTLFKPRSVENPNGVIVGDVVSGDVRMVTITIPFPTTPLTPNMHLADLVGNVLLGNSPSTPLEIAPQPNNTLAQWYRRGDPLTVVTDTAGGVLSLDPLCMIGGTRLLDWDPPSAGKIVPNPVNDAGTLIFTLPSGGGAEIELYSSVGALLRRIPVEPLGASGSGATVDRTITLPTADLPSGSYHVLVRSESGLSSTIFMIAR